MKENIISFTKADRILLHQMQNQLSFLTNLLTSIQSNKHNNDWISETEAQNLLNRKTTTLWKMRNEGKIRFTKMNNKTTYYSYSSIMTWLEQNAEEAFNQINSFNK